MQFPLTIRIPNQPQRSGISSPDEQRIVPAWKRGSLSRYGSREALPSCPAPSPTRPLEPAAQCPRGFECPELPVCSGGSEVARVLQQCPGQAAVTRSACFPWKTRVSLSPHFSATSGCWLMAWTCSAPIFRPYLWVTLCLLTTSKASSESGIISFATEVALGMLLTRAFSSVLQNWCMYRKITENRAGRELKSPLQKVLFTNQNNSEKTILEFNLVAQTDLQNSQWGRLYKYSLQCYFYHSNCFL